MSKTKQGCAPSKGYRALPRLPWSMATGGPCLSLAYKRSTLTSASLRLHSPSLPVRVPFL